MIKFRWFNFFNALFLILVFSIASSALGAENAATQLPQNNAGKVTSRAQPIIIKPFAMAAYNAEIEHIYAHVLNNPHTDLTARLIKITQYFLNRPYQLGPLGEGPQGKYDQGPLGRTDVFDCMTFVETCLALAHANNPAQFKQLLLQIRYQNDQVEYAQRNHFVSLDWNRKSEKLGLIKNITADLGVPIKVARTKIDKPNWYQFATMSRLKQLTPLSPSQASLLLNSLHGLSLQQKSEVAHIDYVPLSELFSQPQNHSDFFTKIPSGAIIEIINPNWDLRKLIGTRLDVQHMGFIIQTRQGVMFREASSVLGQVVDMPLINYLQQVYAFNPAAGIHIEALQNSKAVN